MVPMSKFYENRTPGPDRRQLDQGGANPANSARVSGWYQKLKQQLGRLSPYLVPGHIVTFQLVNPEEKEFFEWLNKTIRVPEAVCAIFIPPSVVQQAMWPLAGSRPSEEAPGLYSLAPDAGAVAAQHCGAPETIVNALFAFPPLSPGIDVYQDGRLLAGYTYKDQAACAHELTDVLATYLT